MAHINCNISIGSHYTPSRSRSFTSAIHIIFPTSIWNCDQISFPWSRQCVVIDEKCQMTNTNIQRRADTRTHDIGTSRTFVCALKITFDSLAHVRFDSTWCQQIHEVFECPFRCRNCRCHYLSLFFSYLWIALDSTLRSYNLFTRVWCLLQRFMYSKPSKKKSSFEFHWFFFLLLIHSSLVVHNMSYVVGSSLAIANRNSNV